MSGEHAEEVGGGVPAMIKLQKTFNLLNLICYCSMVMLKTFPAC